VIAAFFVAITISTSLLTLPVATESGAAAPFVTAVFTAGSAICVTGLSVAERRPTGRHSASWSSALGRRS